MLSAFILSILSYSAVPLVRQLIHHWYVHPGPLVLRTALFKYLTPAIDKDRTVSRRSEPSSRTALMGEQPNPWNVLPLQETFVRWAMAFPFNSTGSLSPTFVSARYVYLSVKLPSAFTLFRTISVRAEETFGRLRYSLGGDRPSQTAHLTLSLSQLMTTG